MRVGGALIVCDLVVWDGNERGEKKLAGKEVYCE